MRLCFIGSFISAGIPSWRLYEQYDIEHYFDYRLKWSSFQTEATKF